MLCVKLRGAYRSTHVAPMCVKDLATYGKVNVVFRHYNLTFPYIPYKFFGVTCGI